MIRGSTLLACLCIAAAAAASSSLSVHAAPPPLPRVCPSADAAYPAPVSVAYQNANDQGLYSARPDTAFDVPQSGVAYRTLFPTTLNSEWLVSWSSDADSSSTFAQHDTLAWRVYAEMGTTQGITPPSVSAAWFSNASSLDFQYDPLGFVAGNVDAGAWSVVHTLSVLGAFEFRDVNANGRYDEGVDVIDSTQDLSSLAWDTPCTSAGRGDGTVAPSAGTNAFTFTNVQFNPSNPMRLTIVVEQASNPANGSVVDSQDGVGAESLLLSPRNVLVSVSLSNYPYIAPPQNHTLLALNVSYLTSRTDGTGDSDLVQLSALDLSGQSGVGGSALGRALNTSDPDDLAMVDCLSTVAADPAAQRSDSYLAWNRPAYDAQEAGGLAMSTLRRIDAAAMPGSAARMFLASAVPSAPRVHAHNLILSNTYATPASVVVSFSLGFGSVVLPPSPGSPADSNPPNDTPLVIGLAAGGGALILLLIGCCACRAKEGASIAAGAAGAGGAGYASLESDDAAWRRKNVEREAAERHAAAIAHARSPSPSAAGNRSSSPASRANTQSGLESNVDNQVVSSLSQQAYSPSEPSRMV